MESLNSKLSGLSIILNRFQPSLGGLDNPHLLRRRILLISCQCSKCLTIVLQTTNRPHNRAREAAPSQKSNKSDNNRRHYSDQQYCEQLLGCQRCNSFDRAKYKIVPGNESRVGRLPYNLKVFIPSRWLLLKGSRRIAIMQMLCEIGISFYWNVCMRAKASFLSYLLLNSRCEGSYACEAFIGIRVSNTDTILVQYKGIAASSIVPLIFLDN